MKKLYITLAIALFGFALTTTKLSAQLQITDTLSIGELVQDHFNTGTLVTISNITFNGMPADSIHPQIGLFSNGLSDSFDMESGMVMYTDDVDRLVGDWNGNMTAEVVDSDIALITGTPVFSCAVLEFDVLIDADALAFNFLFGSVEYAGYTCSQFNDGFGLFISGPGIDGPFSNNAVNIATIPDSDIPVAINTINSGLPSGGYPSENCENANPNWQQDTIYFVNNWDNSMSSVEFNGYTVTIEAYTEVQMGETYHIKFAICNASDGALDSGVLLESGTFEGRLLSKITDFYGEPLKVYPNPAGDRVFLENIRLPEGGNGHLVLTDIRGREVKTIPVTAKTRTEVSLTDVEKGIYLYELWSDTQRLHTGKIVKK